MIKKQTRMNMNLDLSLIACLFGHSLDQRFDDEEKQHEKESNAKCDHVFTRNRLSFLVSTNGNEGTTKSHTHRAILRFHEFIDKSCLVGIGK